MSHTIGIDLQPSKISAAVCRWSDGRWSDPEVVRLGKEDTAAPATVFVAADGNIVCGEIAEERGRVEPERLVDELVRQFGEPAGVLEIGGTPSCWSDWCDGPSIECSSRKRNLPRVW